MDIVMNTTPDAKLPDHTSIHPFRRLAARSVVAACRGAAKTEKRVNSRSDCYNVTMERDEAICRLQQHEADLRRLGVEHLFMFGSTARGEANHDSDVDLFFDYQKGKLGVYELMDVKEYAASILGRKTDIMTRDSLHKTLREAIEATAVRVF
jgi:uncharacterized protein